ncbi:Aminoglycoside phosphotransferase [Penicillium herquei]|nr:Aminoglycoside phosphotransferase [Penicillium herquei]
MEYIEHKQSICRSLEKPESDLTALFLSLSTLSLSKVGSVGLEKHTSKWNVFDRPLSYSMNEIVQLGTLPRSAIPNSTYSKASSYFEALAKLQLSHLISQRNDSIDSENDCRRKFVARILFQRIIRDQKLSEKWLHHEAGPFPAWCDDFRLENVLVDEAETIVGVIDWEFTYAAPYWTKGLGDWCIQYDQRLKTFLEALTDCEEEAIHNGQLLDTQRLSGPMRDSWSSGNFWIMYAARNNFAFDSIYWQKIDQRFFGPTQSLDLEDAWKERLQLLTPEEKDYINECVGVKSEEMETRALIWDPDEYTRAYERKWVE